MNDMDKDIISFPGSWDDVAKMEYMQRRVLVLSVLYYQRDISLVPDKDYDRLSYQLLRLMQSSPDVEKSRYYYAFKTFDATTGFDLQAKLTPEDQHHILAVADIVQNLRK